MGSAKDCTNIFDEAWIKVLGDHSCVPFILVAHVLWFYVYRAHCWDGGAF